MNNQLEAAPWAVPESACPLVQPSAMRAPNISMAPPAALASGVASAQSGNMMNGGGMWGGGWMGGYGGYWMPVLLIVVIGVVIWAVLQKRK